MRERAAISKKVNDQALSARNDRLAGIEHRLPDPPNAAEAHAVVAALRRVARYPGLRRRLVIADLEDTVHELLARHVHPRGHDSEDQSG